jgi:hypothetical protein
MESSEGRSMQITINFEFVNWLAVLVATLAVFVLGGLWYSPILFGGRRLGIVNKGKADSSHPSKIEWIFVGAFILWWLAASMMAAVLGPNATAIYGLNVGLLIGLFLVTPAMGITYIFEKRSHQFWLVNGAYYTISFGLIGVILGALN